MSIAPKYSQPYKHPDDSLTAAMLESVSLRKQDDISLLVLLQRHVGNSDVTEYVFRTLADSSAYSCGTSSALIRHCIEKVETLRIIIKSVEACVVSVHVIHFFAVFIFHCLRESFRTSARHAVQNSRLVEVLLLCIDRHKHLEENVHFTCFRSNVDSIIFLLLLNEYCEPTNDVYAYLLTSFKRNEPFFNGYLCLALLLSANSTSRCDQLADSKILLTLIILIKKKDDRLNLGGVPAALMVVISYCRQNLLENIFTGVENCLVRCIDPARKIQSEHALLALIALHDRCNFKRTKSALDLSKLSFESSHEYLSFLSCRLIEKDITAIVRYHGTIEMVRILDTTAKAYSNNRQIIFKVAQVLSKLSGLGIAGRKACRTLVGHIRELTAKYIRDDQVCTLLCSAINNILGDLTLNETRGCFVAVTQVFEWHLHSEAKSCRADILDTALNWPSERDFTPKPAKTLAATYA